jgi:hypothetical protein
MLETLREKKKDVVNEVAKVIKDPALGTSTPSNPRTLPNQSTKTGKST